MESINNTVFLLNTIYAERVMPHSKKNSDSKYTRMHVDTHAHREEESRCHDPTHTIEMI
jgi:hypothetical protein